MNKDNEGYKRFSGEKVNNSIYGKNEKSKKVMDVRLTN